MAITISIFTNDNGRVEINTESWSQSLNNAFQRSAKSARPLRYKNNMKNPASTIIEDTQNLQPRDAVLGVSGSPRKNGNSDILLKKIISGVEKEGLSSSHLNLSNIHFQGCIGCERCRKDKICTGIIDGMSIIYNLIISSKGLVLVSPTHNYNITSWMKAFIDRLYCFYNFSNDRPRSWSSELAGQNRKAVVAAVCEQENKEDMGFTIEAMKKPLTALGYEIIGELSVFNIFDKGRVKEDKQTLEKAYNLGKKLSQSVNAPATMALGHSEGFYRADCPKRVHPDTQNI